MNDTIPPENDDLFSLPPTHRAAAHGRVLRPRDGDELRANRGSLMTRYGFEPSDRFFLSSQFGASYNRPAGSNAGLLPDCEFLIAIRMSRLQRRTAWRD